MFDVSEGNVVSLLLLSLQLETKTGASKQEKEGLGSADLGKSFHVLDKSKFGKEKCHLET